MKRFLNALVAWNACAWPGIFGAYAVWSGDHYRILSYTAAGAVFGGILLLFVATLLVLLPSWFPHRPFAKKIVDASLPPRRIAFGALIPIALGTAGLLGEYFRHKPSWEQSGEVGMQGHDVLQRTASGLNGWEHMQ